MASEPQTQPPAADAAGEHEHTNRLINETSPYLLQHAHNPVDWFPWGKAAFEEARRRDAPIFLSVGYSTCYWCHVMERESFEHEPTAELMNENFVNIKVDREQRPDVDDIYMTAVMMLRGQGGWPMSVFLTPPGARGPDDPGLEPFWGGTYFPREPRPGMPTFTQVLEGMDDAWENQRETVLQQAAGITEALREHLAARVEPVRLSSDHVAQAVRRLMSMHDPSLGGFGGAPKFPQPVYLEFLLDAMHIVEEPENQRAMRAAAKRTLDAMALGGMYDQVGGGFHRYSTDAKWLVPHFEKMLYDNGQLAALYAEASQTFEDDFYGRVARETCEYALREMQSEQGGFFSAQDAEVDGREGLNYLWTPEQMRKVLDENDAAFAIEVYGLDEGTNFQDPHHPDAPPANVLYLKDRPEALAKTREMSREEFLQRLDRIDAQLLEARDQRKQPRLDDKILAAWNGLMIDGLAQTARAIDEPRFLKAAEVAADFVLGQMRTEGTGLLRSWRKGQAGEPGFLGDYAMVIRGLVSLHRVRQAMATSEQAPAPVYLDAATRLAEGAKSLFWDPEHGGYFDTRANQEDLIVRSRTTHDGAIPAGQSVILHNLLDLHELTGEQRFLDDAGQTLASLSRPIAESPVGIVNGTRGLLRIVASDASLLAEYGMGPEAPALGGAGDEGPAMQPAPVEVYADADRVTVSKDGSGALTLEVRITDENYHVNAHDPGVEGLVGLNVEVRGGTGVRAEVDYPQGEPLDAAWTEQGQSPRVYAGSVRLPVRLVRTDEAWEGRPLLVVTYQACTNEACLAPQRVELDVAIDEG